MSIKYQQKAAAYPLPLKDIKELFLATSENYSVHSFRDRCLLKNTLLGRLETRRSYQVRCP